MTLRSHGLTAKQPAAGVGASCSALYRWAKDAEPKSRRPHRVRPRTWTSELVEAVERIRDDNPMWGKEKIVVRPASIGCSPSSTPSHTASTRPHQALGGQTPAQYLNSVSAGEPRTSHMC